MFTNNFNYGQPVGGYAANPANQAVSMQKVKITDPFTKEERDKLRNKNKGAAFTLTLTEDEELIAKCPHRFEDGSPALRAVDPANHIYQCAICGQHIDLTPVSETEMAKAIETVKNVLNQIKSFGLTLDESIYKEFMMIGPMLKKLPQLYAIANRNFAEVVRGIHPIQQPQNPRGSGFDVINSIMDNTYTMRYGGGLNPAMTQGNVFVPGYGNVAQYQQPMGQPAYQQMPQQYGQTQFQAPQNPMDQMAAQIASLQNQVASMRNQNQQPTAAQTQGAATTAAQQPFAKTNG